MAFLHQKELVLNKQDTANMLNAIEAVRNLTSMVGPDILSRIAAIKAPGINGEHANGILDQQVHIEANFPAVTSSLEIENALNNLVNVAAQRVQEK